jgi:hypothetical protein
VFFESHVQTVPCRTQSHLKCVHTIVLLKVLLQNLSFIPISYLGYRAHVEQKIEKSNTAVLPCFFCLRPKFIKSQGNTLCLQPTWWSANSCHTACLSFWLCTWSLQQKSANCVTDGHHHIGTLVEAWRAHCCIILSSR